MKKHLKRKYHVKEKNEKIVKRLTMGQKEE